MLALELEELLDLLVDEEVAEAERLLRALLELLLLVRLLVLDLEDVVLLGAERLVVDFFTAMELSASLTIPEYDLETALGFESAYHMLESCYSSEKSERGLRQFQSPEEARSLRKTNRTSVPFPGILENSNPLF